MTDQNMTKQKRYYEAQQSRGLSRLAYWAHPDDHIKLKELWAELKVKREQEVAGG